MYIPAVNWLQLQQKNGLSRLWCSLIASSTPKTFSPSMNWSSSALHCSKTNWSVSTCTITHLSSLLMHLIGLIKPQSCNSSQCSIATSWRSSILGASNTYKLTTLEMYIHVYTQQINYNLLSNISDIRLWNLVHTSKNVRNIHASYIIKNGWWEYV